MVGGSAKDTDLSARQLRARYGIKSNRKGADFLVEE